MTDLREIREGRLFFDGCDTVELAKEYGTPLYLMSETAIRERLRTIRREFLERRKNAAAVYASKAYQTLDMVRIVTEEGLGLDVVSGGELYAAIKGGADPKNIYFHGNGKTRGELAEAVEAGVGRVVVDNADELAALNRIALAQGKRQSILFRITPGVDSHTHAYVSTGALDSKFGIPLDPRTRDGVIKAALDAEGIELEGFHFHIGSQLLEIDSHIMAIRILVRLMAQIRDRFGFVARELNLGGGFGVRYVAGDQAPPLEIFTDAMCGEVDSRCAEVGLPAPRLVIEPGRWIVAEAGLTLYTVGSVKEIPGIKTWIAVDGGMGDNPRPALYGARYEAIIANKGDQKTASTYSIAGKYCESGDVLIRDIALPKVAIGDLLAVFTTGAYNHSMASNYNRTPRPPVVMTAGGKHRLSVRRETYDDLIQREL